MHFMVTGVMVRPTETPSAVGKAENLCCQDPEQCISLLSLNILGAKY